MVFCQKWDPSNRNRQSKELEQSKPGPLELGPSKQGLKIYIPYINLSLRAYIIGLMLTQCKLHQNTFFLYVPQRMSIPFNPHVDSAARYLNKLNAAG